MRPPHPKPFPKRDADCETLAWEEQRRFKEIFAATFLATWAANNYEDACMSGQQERLERPPVEDAAFLAGKAWQEWVRCKH